jgi:HK97 family phage prohead protease
LSEIRRRPLDLMDSPEHRSIPIDSFEVEDGDENTLTLTGYASTFQPYEMYGGPSNGQGWVEQIDRGAFERTLKEGPDLHLLINHEGLPLARTKSGDLDLSVDDHGLKVVARLDRSDPDVQRLEPKMRKRAGQTRPLMDEMSFAFRVKGQEWSSSPEFKDDPQALRKITEVSLHKGDVSVVNWGANPTTHAELKSVSDALRVLADCDARELVEARSSDDVLRRAKANLANVGVLESSSQNAAIATKGLLEALSVPTGTFLDGVLLPVAQEARSYSEGDVSTLISSLDAVLDEAFNLVADVDEESLPEPVAQALDLLRGAHTIVGQLMEAAGIFDPDAEESGDRMSADEVETTQERSADEDLATAIQELIDVTRGLKVFIEEFSKRDDSESRDDAMEECDDDMEEDAAEDEEDEEDDEDDAQEASRGMSLAEARSRETALSLADLDGLD